MIRTRLSGIPAIHNRFDRLFDFPTIWGGLDRSTLTQDEQTWSPVVDVKETDGEFVIQADLPGIGKDDVKVDFSDGVLTIEGERKSEETTEEDNYVHVERRYGSFARSFSIPKNVDAENIKATYSNGVLELTLPKKEEAKPKQISVSVN